ncbi:DYW family of nucleic acid deaminase domain-containing protein [Forsythia ovata]|uniref:DYW family of nucleic acid deaminase domain-containing protein n=1 Tax=Forsythia ovata TaxID=205694 RepID=A0ABD1WWB9_9LAMI
MLHEDQVDFLVFAKTSARFSMMGSDNIVPDDFLFPKILQAYGNYMDVETGRLIHGVVGADFSGFNNNSFVAAFSLKITEEKEDCERNLKNAITCIPRVLLLIATIRNCFFKNGLPENASNLTFMNDARPSAATATATAKTSKDIKKLRSDGQ